MSDCSQPRRQVGCLFSQWSVACVLVLLVSACGGGGGEGDPVPGPSALASPPVSNAAAVDKPTPPAETGPFGLAPAPTAAPGPGPARTNPDLVTSVSPPTYAVGSVELGAWRVLQSERSTCGFGAVQQDTRLDAASAAHAGYLTAQALSIGQLLVTHDEDPTRLGFTGRNGALRAVQQGYQDHAVTVNEVLTGESVVRLTVGPERLWMNEERGADAIRSLMGTVYHLTGTMYSGRFAGVGSSHASDAALEVFQFGSLNSFVDHHPQRLGSGVVVSYPCDGAQHVKADFRPATEAPNPFPQITDRAVRLGTPIYLKVDEGSTLAVTSASIVRQEDGVELPYRSLTRVNDPAGQLGRHEFFMVPASALRVGAAYTVTVSGTVDGEAFAKTFTFRPSY